MYIHLCFSLLLLLIHVSCVNSSLTVLSPLPPSLPPSPPLSLSLFFSYSMVFIFFGFHFALHLPLLITVLSVCYLSWSKYRKEFWSARTEYVWLIIFPIILLLYSVTAGIICEFVYVYVYTCMYVCMYICTYVYTCICMCTYTYVCMYVCMYVCIVCTYIMIYCMYVCTYCLYVNVFIILFIIIQKLFFLSVCNYYNVFNYVCMYAYIYCMYVCTYACMYVHISLCSHYFVYHNSKAVFFHCVTTDYAFDYLTIVISLCVFAVLSTIMQIHNFGDFEVSKVTWE